MSGTKTITEVGVASVEIDTRLIEKRIQHGQ